MGRSGGGEPKRGNERNVNGWFVFPVYDAHIKSSDVLGSQHSPVMRTLMQFIKGLVLMKNVRLRIPKMAGDSISITDGLPLSTPFVCGDPSRGGTRFWASRSKSIHLSLSHVGVENN